MLLTPFYDLVCTRVYPGLSPDFAFAVGGEVRPGPVTNEHVKAMAAEVGVNGRFATRLAQELASQLPVALDGAILELTPSLGEPARRLVDRVQRFVRKTTAQTAARLAAPV